MLTPPKLFAGPKPILLLALLIPFLLPAAAAARDPVRCEMKAVSEKLRDFFAGRRIKELAVGDVTNADPTTPSSAGPGIREVLIQEVERAELKVKLRADVGLTVTYRGRKIPQKEDRKAEQLVVEMRFTALFAADNSQEDILTYRVMNAEAVAHILGLTACPQAPTAKAREQQTVLAFSNPAAALDGTVVLAGEKAPFGVEILIDDRPLKPVDRDGFGLVELKRDQTYAVRLVNRSPIEVAVRLSVDGLNVFTFSELRHKDGPYKGAPLYDMVLVPPGKSVTVPGWHRNNTTTSRFKITEYADTAAAKMGKTTDLGTVTATFCAAWEMTPPADEPDGSRGPGDDGTGFGASAAVNYAPVQRTIGAVRASVAVRYKVPPAAK